MNSKIRLSFCETVPLSTVFYIYLPSWWGEGKWYWEHTCQYIFPHDEEKVNSISHSLYLPSLRGRSIMVFLKYCTISHLMMWGRNMVLITYLLELVPQLNTRGQEHGIAHISMYVHLLMYQYLNSLCRIGTWYYSHTCPYHISYLTMRGRNMVLLTYLTAFSCSTLHTSVMRDLLQGNLG